MLKMKRKIKGEAKHKTQELWINPSKWGVQKASSTYMRWLNK